MCVHDGDDRWGKIASAYFMVASDATQRMTGLVLSTFYLMLIKCEDDDG